MKLPFRRFSPCGRTIKEGEMIGYTGGLPIPEKALVRRLFGSVPGHVERAWGWGALCDSCTAKCGKVPPGLRKFTAGREIICGASGGVGGYARRNS